MPSLADILNRMPDLSDVDAVYAALAETETIESFPFDKEYLADFPADVAEKIRDRTTRTVTMAEKEGIETPSLEAVTEEVERIRIHRAAGAYVSRLINAVGLLLDAGQSEEEIKAAAREVV